jgi:Chromosome segregation ATPases
MTKAKSNALEALRALIAERQQYEQWISVLESKRDGTPPHVFEKVHGDYNTRLQRVVTDIKGHAEELQLSISALSSRLVEVAREEDTRRDALQEAELRAAVGEYEPQQWEQLRTEAERGLEKVAADRASLDSQLVELRSIQKLSEVGSVGEVETVVRPPVSQADSSTARDMMESNRNGLSTTSAATSTDESPSQKMTPEVAVPSRQQEPLPFDGPAAPSPVQPISTSTPAAAANPVSTPAPQGGQKARTGKTPPFGSSAPRPRPPEPRADQSKTLKCPECGTPNYATEWYCERCGGELATM